MSPQNSPRPLVSQELALQKRPDLPCEEHRVARPPAVGRDRDARPLLKSPHELLYRLCSYERLVCQRDDRGPGLGRASKETCPYRGRYTLYPVLVAYDSSPVWCAYFA